VLSSGGYAGPGPGRSGTGAAPRSSIQVTSLTEPPSHGWKLSGRLDYAGSVCRGPGRDGKIPASGNKSMRGCRGRPTGGFQYPDDSFIQTRSRKRLLEKIATWFEAFWKNNRIAAIARHI